MLKPPAPTIPGMTDTLDFVKNLWGSMNIPGTGMPGMSGLASPTLSTDDLDKRIADLKAVESWLNMNISMLRGTIQAMEVQRGTLAALKSMGASMAEAMRQSGVSTDKMAGMPFAPFFTPPPSAAGKPAAPTPAPSPAASAGASGGSAQPGAAAPAGTDAGAAMGMPAAMAWWNMLQDQFTQAVNTAMSSAASSGPGAAAPPSASAPTPGPAANPAAGAVPTTPDVRAAAPGQPSDAPADAGSANGNGKARSPRPRADKP